MSEIDDVVESRLRAVGQRYTPKRRALVEALRRAGNPVATPDLAGGSLRLPQSSVYRNLVVLEQAGIVHRVVTGEEFARYELTEDLTEHHHHLVCRSCGTVEDVTVPHSFERQVARTVSDVAGKSGFSAVAHRLDVLGTCRDCARPGDEAIARRGD
jgi:Fur family transcriptional regulator, ferric uptake regulator